MLNDPYIIRNLINSLKPVLDTEGKFLFFSNNKVMQTSLNRGLLSNRAIIYKDDPIKYNYVCSKYSEEFLCNVFKFTIVRNPWDLVVSAYFYLKKIDGSILANKKINFADFVDKHLKYKGASIDPHFNEQHPKAFIDKECYVNLIGRFEHPESFMPIISKVVGCPSVLPHKNRTKHKPYQYYYNNNLINIVNSVYEKDIELFGYKFNDS
jgi:hypothetical protein